MLDLSKKLMALSVSVVLSASVLLAGCGKVEGDADDSDKSKVIKSDSISESAETALKTVGNTAQNIQDIFTGNADKAYSSEIKVSLGKPVTDAMGLSDIKDIVLTSDVKAKNANIETLLSLKYGKEEVISADIVRDDETGNVYFGVPQLSPGYLMMSGADIDSYIEAYTEELLGELSVNDIYAADAIDDMEITVPEIDTEEIEKQLEVYEKAIKDNLPSGKDKDKATGEIDGVKYTLDCKTYTFSGNDAVKVISAVVDELKKDEAVLSMIDEYGAAEDVTRQDFINELDDMVSEMKNSDGLDETVDFDVYYQGDDFAGLSFSFVDDNDYWTDTEALDMLWYATDTEFCGKLEITDKSVDKDDPDYTYDNSMSMSCSAKLDDGATDVSLNIEADDAKMSFVIDDFQIVDEESGAFTGTVKFTMSVDDQTLVIKTESNSTSGKLDISTDMTFNGEEYISIVITGEETKATDVEIPSGTIYNVNNEDELEAYGATIDVEKFQKDLENVLGEELYNYLFVGSTSYDDWDYDYDYDDWAYWEEEYDYNNDYGYSYGDDSDSAYTGIGRVIDDNI